MANQLITQMTRQQKILSNRICFVLVVLVISVNCAYYSNGIKAMINPIQKLIWASDDYISYKTNGDRYVTESLENTNEEYEIYFSRFQPKSQNINYFYTVHNNLIWDIPVPFFPRHNLPQCWLDSNDLSGINIQKVLINSASVHLLQNKSKIRIQTLQIPDNDLFQSKIPDCSHSRYNWTNKNNDKYVYKEFISLYQREQLAVTYSDHIQVLFYDEKKQQYEVVQTIDVLLDDGVKRFNVKDEDQNYYEFNYYVKDEQSPQQYQRQMIVIVLSEQLWIYHREKDAETFLFTNKVRLNQTILSLHINSYQQAYVLIKDDCSVYEISLLNEEQQPIKIVSLQTLCLTSLLNLQLGVRENGDLIVVGVEHITEGKLKLSAYLQEQLTIYVVPVQTPIPTKLTQYKTYHIALSHKQSQQFHLIADHFISQTDYMFLLLQQLDNQMQLFMAFDIKRLNENNDQQLLELQWQWISQRFQNGVQDYSIDQTGIIVLEYDPLTRMQDLSWYRTAVIVGEGDYSLNQPLDVSRVSTVAFYQNTSSQIATAYDFLIDSIHYKLNYSNNQLIAFSPSGNFTILINPNNFQKIQIYKKQLLLGTIQLDHQINDENTILQFMNDSIIVQFSKIQLSPQEIKFILNGFVIDSSQGNQQFMYKTLQEMELTQLTLEQIKINSENIVYLNQDQGKIIILQIGQEEFQVEQDLQLPFQLLQNVKQLKLGLSQQGNIYTVEGGKQIIYQWVFCEQYEYLDKGQCLHIPIDPDSNPFPIVTIIAAIIGCLAIIFIVTYQILRHKALKRRVQLKRSLIESQQGEQNSRVENMEIDVN